MPSFERTTDLAERSARLNALTVVTSGLAAPLRTAAPEARAGDIGAAFVDNLPLLCQCVDDRPRDDRHIEHCAVFDLVLERIGRVIANGEPHPLARSNAGPSSRSTS